MLRYRSLRATMLMADLAGLLGCVVGFPPAFTAISLVALGTSIPDLFASMNAARADAYADASIGNVMGSNSVNVFMGLGLPWLIATIYWDFFSEGEALVVCLESSACLQAFCGLLVTSFHVVCASPMFFCV